MAVADDLRRLANEDVVYLTYTTSLSVDQSGGEQGTSAQTPVIVYRGRLHQALDGSWVFNASTGTNGVVAIMLGNPAAQGPGQGFLWGSSETPTDGLRVEVNQWAAIPVTPPMTFVWQFTMGTVVPTEIAT